LSALAWLGENKADQYLVGLISRKALGTKFLAICLEVPPFCILHVRSKLYMYLTCKK